MKSLDASYQRLTKLARFALLALALVCLPPVSYCGAQEKATDLDSRLKALEKELQQIERLKATLEKERQAIKLLKEELQKKQDGLDRDERELKKRAAKIVESLQKMGLIQQEKPGLADPADKLATEVVCKLGQAVLATDLDGMMKLTDVPFVSDYFSEKEEIKDKAELRKAYKLFLDANAFYIALIAKKREEAKPPKMLVVTYAKWVELQEDEKKSLRKAIDDVKHHDPDLAELYARDLRFVDNRIVTFNRLGLTREDRVVIAEYGPHQREVFFVRIREGEARIVGYRRKWVPGKLF